MGQFLALHVHGHLAQKGDQDEGPQELHRLPAGALLQQHTGGGGGSGGVLTLQPPVTVRVAL